MKLRAAAVLCLVLAACQGELPELDLVQVVAVHVRDEQVSRVLLLAALAAVIRTGSFERAAQQLHVTPSAVSQRVKLLEERLGTILVVRSCPCGSTARPAHGGASPGSRHADGRWEGLPAERREALVHQRHHGGAAGGDGADPAEDEEWPRDSAGDRLHRRGGHPRGGGHAPLPLHGAEGAAERGDPLRQCAGPPGEHPVGRGSWAEAGVDYAQYRAPDHSSHERRCGEMVSRGPGIRWRVSSP